MYDANKEIQKPLTDKICELIDLYMKEAGAKVNVDYVGYEAAKWVLLVSTFDWFFWNDEASCPARPDNGVWTLTGYETIDWKEPAFVGEHGYFSYDKDEVKQEIDFRQFKFYAGKFYKKTPEYLTYAEAYTLWLMCTGRKEDCEDGYVRKLLEYGYLKTSNGVVEPNVVKFTAVHDAANFHNPLTSTELCATT